MLIANSFALPLQSVFQPETLADFRVDFEKYLTEGKCVGRASRPVNPIDSPQWPGGIECPSNQAPRSPYI
jgi:hypothetical protein